MATVPFDTNTDGTVLVGPVGAMQQIVVKGLDMTADGQATVSLKRGSAVVWKTYAMNDPAKLGGIVLNVDVNRDLGLTDLDGNQVPSGGELTIGLDTSASVAGSITYSVIGPSGP